MTSSRLVRVAFLVAASAFAAGAASALASPDGERAVVELENRARELRAKSEALRAAGDAEKAEAVAREAGAVEEKLAKVRAMRAEQAARDAERASMKKRAIDLRANAAELKAAGQEDAARDALRQAEEIEVRLKGAKPEGAAKVPGALQDLDRMAAELREKAKALRERGSVADAELLEEKAARVEKAAALRTRSNETERRAHEAKAAGREREAQELIDESGRLWRESEELLGAPRKPAAPKPELANRIEHLRTAAKHLREAGAPDLAEKVERQAADEERAMRERKEGGGDADALRAEAEKLRRRLAELEEELRRREAK